MDNSIVRGLCDKLYEKRKNAALELELLIKDCNSKGEKQRIEDVVKQLVDIFSAPSNALHSRNGGLIGLAATAIALGVDTLQYAHLFLEPLLLCFSDSEARIRYFACESMYNICKCVKGEILVYFNHIFDALSRLAADPDTSVQNGADMVNLMLRDIVAECAAVYVPKLEQSESVQRFLEETSLSQGVVLPVEALRLPPEKLNGELPPPKQRKAFSLELFMPLLSERIQVLNSLTRSFLVQWITLLDSVPDLELITFLPAILEGLLGYLSDPANDDVRIPTANLLSEFLREIRNVSELERGIARAQKGRKSEAGRRDVRPQGSNSNLTDGAQPFPEGSEIRDGPSTDTLVEDRGAYIPGQGVKIDFGAIVEILLRSMEPQQEDVVRLTALNWIAAFLDFAEDVMMPFTPRLIPVILASLADDYKSIHHVALTANQRLFASIQKLPTPPAGSMLPPASAASSVRNVPSSPPAPPQTNQPLTRVISKTAVLEGDAATAVTSNEKPSTLPLPKRTNTILSTASADSNALDITSSQSRPESPNSALSLPAPMSQSLPLSERSISDPFDYQATVSALTVQFLSDHDETKVAALKWLMMLHQKAPSKILAMDDGTFPVLLKILSDGSEVVVKHDLQLLAQISSSSEEGYFRSFMENLLELFSTDRRLLDTRGSLIVRQLCVSLGAERIYRTFSEILEKEEDLEFASVIVQKLNMILMTAPEMTDCRKRLKSADGQSFFITLYRSWCHNAVAVFALCLLAQAYEHASNLLMLFADLEITVQFLVQIDKLVQLIESPVFTYLRLQLLEPEKNPFLFKCLYGLLMILPQSSAFVSLRNRLAGVSSTGFLHVAPRAATMTAPPVPAVPRSKMGNKEDIKWQDLLNHFRAVQMKHEKARRQDLGSAPNGDSAYSAAFQSGGGGLGLGLDRGPNYARPQSRRKVTNDSSVQPPPQLAQLPNNAVPPVRPSPMALSPLNPRARGPPALPALMGGVVASAGTSPNSITRPMSPPLALAKQKPVVSGRR